MASPTLCDKVKKKIENNFNGPENVRFGFVSFYFYAPTGKKKTKSRTINIRRFLLGSFLLLLDRT